MEFLIVIAFFGYIYYLRNYADLRTPSEKEAAALAEGIILYENGQTGKAYDYFDARIRQKPKSSIAYLYRGLCQHKLGDNVSALKDIQSGLSYDDQVYELHLGMGKIYLEQGETENALSAFDRAVSTSEEQSEAPYLWRAKALTRLGRVNEANLDHLHAEELKEALKTTSGKPVSKAPFFDKRLAINMAMIVMTSALLIYVVKSAESIHLPYLVAVFAAISIGFVEPYKGWLLAIMQCTFMLTGYFLLTTLPTDGARQELENFSLYGAMILTFAASFLGGFLKRALNMK
ncbi:hypothetical protein LZD49_06240 [Dyadobacter sp. CY261]|uniref:tetratricopeptide repeat protein n=1 Tax=Dyadobacter sp. CY261 TaxID=2907203 RepID=UPI001F3F0485|nr:tetratricopeptide repeat protein [Dyadobacter sp. CY261]MCF0070063.1 hypothetical protein [Dyadobacter sp. CY261]